MRLATATRPKASALNGFDWVERDATVLQLTTLPPESTVSAEGHRA
jgi:hypothetical protein